MKKAKELFANDLLFEIGCEELPATSLADIFESATSETNSFAEKFRKLLTEKRLCFKSCQVWATPRRLVFYVKELTAKQKEQDEMTKLFVRDDAYSTEGVPTEKFLTILKHRGVSIEQTVVSDFNGKPFIFIRKAQACEKTTKILPEIFQALIKSLNFPKNMKWDDSGIVFSRPIRRALAIFGDKPLNFKIGHTKSSSDTVIFLKGKRISVPAKDIATYFKQLNKFGVILDQVERKKIIKAELERLAATHQAKLYEDPFLLNEVNYLVEIPHVLVAPFGGKFLELPLEVLAVSMARKQRIFSMQGKNSFEIAPSFLAVLDGARTKAEEKIISKNMESILQAKLQDSLFFFREDAKVDLEAKRQELKNLVFLKGAGSMFDKSDRLVRLAKKISVELDLPAEQSKDLEQAAYFCKTDLLTQMVGEFPELQGVMGSHYARKNGISDEAATAIGDQYLPRTTHDRLPKTDAGALLSILDKTDLVVACFGLGLEPTSSMDPYGLRRSALAIFKLMIEKKFDFSFTELVCQTQKELGTYILKDKEAALAGKLDAFFKDRFRAVLGDHGMRDDLVDAAMASGFEKPYETYRRVKALAGLLKSDSFAQACKVVERTFNILKGVKETLPTTIDPSIFTESLEHEVFKRYQAYRDRIIAAREQRDYAVATSLYAEAFFDILGEFFEKVFINTEDAKVRANRLLLLKTIKELYTQNIAELSRIRLT